MRKTTLSSQQDYADQDTPNEKREYVAIDTFVHAFASCLAKWELQNMGRALVSKTTYTKNFKTLAGQTT